jgi:urea transporter
MRFITSVLNSYSVIFFSQSRLFGAVLMALTFAMPRFGALGLAGVCVAYVAARLFGFDRSNVQQGVLLFNSLLVSLTLAYLDSYQPLGGLGLSVLLVASSVGALLLSVVLNDLFPRYFAVPPLSLPFVVVGFALFHLFHALNHVPLVPSEAVYLLPTIETLPPIVEGFLQALGAIFFLPRVTVGLVILVGLVAWSRLAVLHGAVGYLAGVLFMRSLGMDTQPEALGYIGFNFVFCGIALGGVFLIPSRGSLLLAALGACFCVIFAASTKMALCYLNVPPLALPLNVVVLSTLYALKCRAQIDRLSETPFEPESPERNLRRFAVDRARFPAADEPRLLLPFFGERVITQSFNGGLTHREEWRDALDFEMVDEYGEKFSRLPLDLEGNHVFGAPVLAPCEGTVVKVVNHVRDNMIEEINTDQNWGNLIIIRSDAGWCVKLCHLQQGSIEVVEGARVAAGQLIGRCGNSGRSPVPHLHMQAQATDLIGDHTISFRLVRYFTADGRYHASGVPSENDLVSPALFDPAMAAVFEFGDTPWRCLFNGRVETIHSSFNTQGDRVLSTDGASLTARIKDQTFQTLDHNGSAAGVLYHLHLGLASVPLVCGTDVEWSDRVGMRPLLRLWAVVLLDLFSPFVGYPMAEVEYHSIRLPDGAVRVVSTITYSVGRFFLRRHSPSRLEITVSADGVELLTQ